MPSPRDLFIYALLVLMETLAGFTVIVGSSLLDITSLGYSMFGPLLLSGLAGLVTGLAVAAIGVRAPWNRILLLAGAIVSAGTLGLVVSRHPLSFLVAFFLLGILYWRGLSLSQEPPSAAEVQGRFGFGFAVLFVGLLWVLARGILYNHVIWYMLAVTGIAYTVVAMTALVAARTERHREPGSGTAVVLAVALQLGLLLLVSLAALQVFAFDLVGSVWQWSHPVWDAIGAVAFGLVGLLSRPVEWFIALVRPVHSHGRTLTYVPPGTSGGGGKLVRPHRPSSSVWVVLGALALAFLLIAGVGALIWRALPRITRYRPERGYREERKALWSPADALRAFIAWLRSILIRSVDVADRLVGRTRRRVFGDYPDDPVRRVYAQMLRRSTAAGLVRRPACTPQEFHAELALRWPAGTHHFAALTEAYELRRYGDVELDSEELQRLRRHWHGVRAMMRVVPPLQQVASSEAISPGAIEDVNRHWLQPLRRTGGNGREPLIGGTEYGWARTAVLLTVCVVAPILCVVVFLIVLSTLSAHTGLPIDWYLY